MKNEFIIVRGGGDLATGTIHKLWGAGFSVIVLETNYPSAIRRQVAVSEAVYEGTVTVEGLTAQKAESLEQMNEILKAGNVPVVIDPEGKWIEELKPMAVVDAILAKKNLGTNRSMAPLTIALGPGFVAGEDVDCVIETMRGHNLGRIIRRGTAVPNTGIPGNVGGFTKERVIHAQTGGILYNRHQIGDYVQQNEEIAVIAGVDGEYPVRATISGLLRGLIRDGFPVTQGFKIADIDPRKEEYDNCFTISDKARCIAGGVLEAVCGMYNIILKER